MDLIPPAEVENRPNQYLSQILLSNFFRQSRVGSVIDYAIVIFLILLLLLVPLPFGSVQSLPVFVIESVSVLCFLLWLLKFRFCSDLRQLSEFRSAYEEYKEADRARPFLVRYPALAKVLRIVTLRKYPQKYDAADLLEVPDFNSPYLSFFGYPVRKTGLETILMIFVLLNLIQIIPLPFFLVALISPGASAIYKSAQFNSHWNFASLSVNPFVTASKLCQYVAYLLLFIVAVNTLYRRRFAWAILLALICSVTFQSIYGLLESLSRGGHIFGYKKPFWLQIASGTFINPNHYASYLAMQIVLILSIALKLKQPVATSSRTLLRLVFLFLNSKILLCFSIIVLSFVAIVYSRSRMGLILAGFSLLLFLLVYVRKMATRHRGLISMAFVSIVLLVMIAAGAGPLRQRFERLGTDILQKNGRIQVWIDTGRMIRDFPLTGVGSGAFGEVFPMYQSVVQSVYTYAHNDFLQLIAETGIFSICLFIAACSVVTRRLTALLSRSIESFSVVQIGAFFSLVVAFLSSLVHFSFQIPAISVTTAILAAVFFAKHEKRKRRTAKS